MPRILLITEKFAPEIGGACAVAEALAANLPAHVTVAAPRFEPDKFDYATYDRRFPFPVHRVPAFTAELPRNIPGRLRGPLQFAFNAAWTRPRAIRSLVAHLRQHPADVLCINTLSCYWLPAALKRHFPTLRTVFYLHGEEISSHRRRRLDDLAQAQLRLAEAVVTVSTFTRSLALGCGVPADRLTIIHNGVDTERFTPGPADPALIARWGLAGKKILLCLARLDERKGQDMLLRALPAILSLLPETVLVLAGGGDDAPRLRALAAELRLGSAVVFTGPVSNAEVVQFYRLADLYAMPNRATESGDTEGFGLVFLEAGACAKPVVGGRAGGVPDAILEGETGLLVDGREPAEIAAAVLRLLRDPELAARMGQNGLAHSRRNSWPAQAQRFLTLCEELVK